MMKYHLLVLVVCALVAVAAIGAATAIAHAELGLARSSAKA
jgi:hypothetical protein